MKNIETVNLYPEISDSEFTKLQNYYDFKIPKEFEDTVSKLKGKFVFNIAPMSFSQYSYDSVLTNVNIDYFVNESEKEDITEVYKRYVTCIISQRLKSTLPYPQALSCNVNGQIKIVHYKKFITHINKLLNHYCYKLVSEESYKDRNGEQTVILKYELDIKDI